MYISFTHCSLICFYFQTVRDFLGTHFSKESDTNPWAAYGNGIANTQPLYLGLSQMWKIFQITRLFSNLSHLIWNHKISGLKGTPKNIKSNSSNVFEIIKVKHKVPSSWFLQKFLSQCGTSLLRTLYYKKFSAFWLDHNPWMWTM